MKHPEILLLPLLMFADYFLTVLGAVQREKKYGDHFRAEHYELNPVWQKAIRQKKWFNPRHILATLLTSGFFAFILEFEDLSRPFTEGLLGCLFVAFGILIGRHLSNILIFRRLTRGREEISGQITMAHSLLLSISMSQYLVVAVPMVLLAIFSPTPFVLGGLAGTGLVFASHLRWMRLHAKQASMKAPEATTPPPPMES